MEEVDPRGQHCSKFTAASFVTGLLAWRMEGKTLHAVQPESAADGFLQSPLDETELGAGGEHT